MVTLENFINKCFKRFMNNIQVAKETSLKVEKELLVLALPYLSLISLQTRTKLKQPSKKHP